MSSNGYREPIMRASEIFGRVVYDETGESPGRIVDLLAHQDASGKLFVTAAMVTPGRRGRLLGYERAGLTRPWLIRRIAQWLHRGIREIDLTRLRLEAQPNRRPLPQGFTELGSDVNR